MAMTFTRPALIQVVGDSTYTLSDHNRSTLAIDYEIIEDARRTAKGVRRKYHIAQKRTFSVSWDKLPGTDVNTVDGFTGADNLAAMVAAETGSMTLNVRDRAGADVAYTVHIVGFDIEHVKRFTDDNYYNVSITFEEV